MWNVLCVFVFTRPLHLFSLNTITHGRNATHDALTTVTKLPLATELF
jgi:hypothetical protein